MVVFYRIVILVLTVVGSCAMSVAADTPPDSISLPSLDSPLKVAGLMYRPVKWDKEANTTRLEAAIREAKKGGAQLVVTPEGALEGYLINDVRNTTDKRRPELIDRFNKIAEPIEGPYIQRFQKLCKELHVFLVLGFLEADGEKTYNTAVFIDSEGKIVGKYRKTHFAQGYKNGDKKGYNPVGYTRGTEYPVFDVAGHKLGIMICFDRRVPKVAKQLAKNGADLIVNPSYGMTGDCNRRHVGSRAKENHIPVLFVHPDQVVLATSEGRIQVDARPKEKDPRTSLVEIAPYPK